MLFNFEYVWYFVFGQILLFVTTLFLTHRPMLDQVRPCPLAVDVEVPGISEHCQILFAIRIDESNEGLVGPTLAVDGHLVVDNLPLHIVNEQIYSMFVT